MRTEARLETRGSDVVRWRRRQLVTAGFEPAVAAGQVCATTAGLPSTPTGQLAPQALPELLELAKHADVLAIVSDVAHAATIKGTFEYRGEDSLDKAEFQENSRLFPAWTEPGKAEPTAAAEKEEKES